jgi:hypothetical protein
LAIVGLRLLRYCNVDFVFANAIKTFGRIKECLVSYDIACQWFPNLSKRSSREWPENLRLPTGLKLTPMIPAFHYPAHQTKNHDEYDPKLVVGNGTSDNEGIERFWSSHNALGPSTKSMGPETRQMVLDDHINGWNWAKVTGMGKWCLIRLLEGVCLFSMARYYLASRIRASCRKSQQPMRSSSGIYARPPEGTCQGMGGCVCSLGGCSIPEIKESL